MFAIFLFFILAQTASFQTWSKAQIIKYLNDHIDNEFSVGNIDMNVFTGFKIEKLLIKDQKSDTLIYCGVLKVGLAQGLGSLWNNALSIESIELTDALIFNVRYKYSEPTTLNQFIKQFNRKKSTGGKGFQLNIETVKLNNVSFVNENISSSSRDIYTIGKGKLQVRTFEPKAKHIAFRSADISNVYVLLSKNFPIDSFTNTKSPGRDSIQEDENCEIPLVIAVDQVNISASSFNLHDFRKPSDGISRFDPRHIEFQNIDVSLNNFVYDDLKMTWRNQIMCLATKSDFVIKNLNAEYVSILPDLIGLYNCELTTGNSYLKDTVELLMSSYEDLKNFQENVYLNIHSKNSEIGVQDILYFIPEKKKVDILNRNIKKKIRIDGEILGQINSLKSNQIHLSVDRDLEFEGRVAIRNITKSGEELLNIKSKKLRSSIGFVKSLVPQFKLPEQYDRLGNFDFVGEFDGYFEDFVSYGRFGTELGYLVTDLRIDISQGKSKAKYSGSIAMDNFYLGALFSQLDLRGVNLKAQVRNGTGLTWETLNADLDMNVGSAQYKGVNYSGISFNGKLNKDLLDGKLISTDEKLRLKFQGKIANLNSRPEFDFTAQIFQVNLKDLGLSKQNFSITANMEADLEGKNIDDATGWLKIDQGVLIDMERQTKLNLGSIQISKIKDISGALLKIQTEFAQASLKGNVKVNDVFPALKYLVSQSLPLWTQELNWSIQQVDPATNFDFYIDIGKLTPLLQFARVPMSLENATLKGNLNKSALEASLNGKVEKLEYDTHKLFDLKLDARVLGNKVQANISSSKYNFNNKTWLNEIKATLLAEDSIMNLDLYSKDSVSKNDFIVANMQVSKHLNSYSFHFLDETLVLDSTKWTVRPGSEIKYSGGKWYVRDFEIENKYRSVSIEDIDNKGIQIYLQNVNIDILNLWLRKKSFVVSGIATVDIKIPDLSKLEKINADIAVEYTKIGGVHYGKVYLFAVLDSLNSPLKIKLKNEYKQYLLEAEGSLKIPTAKGRNQKNWEGDFVVNLQNYPIRILENFIASISETSGFVTGEVNLMIRNSKILLRGEATATEVQTKINYLGVRVFANDQKIYFENDKLIFDKVTAKDELDNPIQIDGYLRQDNFSSFYISLEMKSQKALLLNTSKSSNSYYYGKVIGEFRSTFEGNLSNVNLYTSLHVLKGSSVTIPVNYNQDIGEAKFLDFKRDTVKSDSINWSATSNSIPGMNFLMDLSANDNVEVSLVFDEAAGDRIKSYGRGNLQIASSPYSDFSIHGSYEVERGEYLFTLLNFVNKPFTIKRGGLIQWKGDPLNAEIDLEASYGGLYTSMSTFLAEYLNDEKLLREASARTQVELTMLLNGSLLAPDIHFKLRFPDLTGELKGLAESKINTLENNEDLLNQQVFGLLVFGSFIESNNVFNSGLSGSLTRNFSELLSNQLSIFASNLLSEAWGKNSFISGVDVNVAYDVVKTYNSEDVSTNSGEVAISLKHRLLDDQWAVTLGGNYKTNSAIYYSTNFTPESVIEWNTPVPGLKLRFYYKGEDSYYGVRHKVGSGISFRKEFDSFELFKKSIEEQVKRSRPNQ